MKWLKWYLIIFLILFISIGFVSASGDVVSSDDYGALSVGDSVDAGVLGTDDVNIVGSDIANDDSAADDIAACDMANNANIGAGVLGAGMDKNLSSNYYDSESVSDSISDEVTYDEGYGSDSDGPSYVSVDPNFDVWDDEYASAVLEGLSGVESYQIITANITKYDFNDKYKIRVVNGSGDPVYLGYVDFYVNHELVSSSFLNIDGTASFNLNSCINSSGTYDIISMYSSFNGSDVIMDHQRIAVGDVPPYERDIQIIFENIKLYDPGESYRVRVVDINGNPVRKGFVCFVVYDRILYSNLTDDGFASVVLPADMNFTGNLLIWSFYSDMDLYDLCVCEQVSIGTRSLSYLDRTTIGYPLLTSWNNYSFVYEDGKYIAPIDSDVYLVVDLSGRIYSYREYNPSSGNQLKSIFSSFKEDSVYDLIQINLKEGVEYYIDSYVWSDQEFNYASRVSFGQLIINGNGATIKSNGDINFMYVGSEANVNILNVTIKNFNHCFINHGALLCRDSIFRDNLAYKFDVSLWGSGTVIHNYNTALFDRCGFYNNSAEQWGIVIQKMGGSILYAESYSLTLFKDFYGRYYTDALYCCNFSTVIFYDDDMHFGFNESEIHSDAYFVKADRDTFYSADEWVVNVSDVNGFIKVLYAVNSFVNASKVTINLAPGNYTFSVDDYNRVRAYDWRHQFQYVSAATYVVIKDRYLLDVGLCPVVINGTGAKIFVTGNDEDDDYHFANVGKYGSLTLEGIQFSGFNSAFNVQGTVSATSCLFMNNKIVYTVQKGYGGAFRSYGGSLIFNHCRFMGNAADSIDGNSTKDIYAIQSSYVELNNSGVPVGYLNDSYLKASTNGKKYIVLKYSVFEDAFETGVESVDFIAFNISDDNSIIALNSYLYNHSVSCLYINFTGDCIFPYLSYFERNMAVIFNSNGFDVRIGSRDLDVLEFSSTVTMSFIGFNFNGIRFSNKGTCSFYNCSFSNVVDEEDCFFKNEGSCTFSNCTFNHILNCEDGLFYNTGSLRLYDCVLSDYSFEDYGAIYNKGGSVACLETKFMRNSVAIYNFASGDCAIGGLVHGRYDLTFDQPWSNAKRGLIKGIFLLGTALITYGVGSAIGVALPGIAGLVVSAVAGAAIGAGAGAIYGAWEGSVYHDYSGLWSNVFSFAVLGMGMAQAGFNAHSEFFKKVNDVLHPRGGDGGAGAGAGAGAGSGAGSGSGATAGSGSGASAGGAGAGDISGLQQNAAYDKLFNDPNFLDALGNCLRDDMGSLSSLQAEYPDFVYLMNNHYMTMIISAPKVSALEMVNLYLAVQSFLSSNNIANPAPVNPVSNVINRVEANGGAANVDVNHVENPVPLDGGNVLGEDFLHQFDFYDMLDPSGSLSYLRNFINLDTYRLMQQNANHTLRVLNLLVNYNNLYQRSRGLAFQSNSGLTNNLRIYMNNFGPNGRASFINTLFNPNTTYLLRVWESFYNVANREFESILQVSGLNPDYLNQEGANASDLVNLDCNALIQSLDAKIQEGDPDYERYVSLRERYNANFASGNQEFFNFDLLLTIYHDLMELNRTAGVNHEEYDDAVSFDYVASISNNVYNGLFNIPDAVDGATGIIFVTHQLQYNMNLLRQINATLYDEVIQEVFNGTAFAVWLNGLNQLDMPSRLAALKKAYKDINAYLLAHAGTNINQRNMNFYYVTNRFRDYAVVYAAIDDETKVLINKYFYDRCSELIKNHNGVVFNVGIKNLAGEFNELSNIFNVSEDYFSRLSTLYSRLVTSTGVDDIFNREIAGLSSEEISKILLDDYLSFLRTHSQFREILPDMYKGHIMLLTNITSMASNDSNGDLVRIYNELRYLNSQFSIYYKLYVNLYLHRPLDPESHAQMSYWDLIRTLWGNDVSSEVETLYGPSENEELIITKLIEHLFNNNQVGEGGNQGRHDMLLQNTLFLKVFNMYLKYNLGALNLSEVGAMLIVAGDAYPFSNNGNFDDVFSALASRDEIISLQRQLNHRIANQPFTDIDVANLLTRIDALESSSPVSFWLLNEYLRDVYGMNGIEYSLWNFNKSSRQFCIRNVGGNAVSYSDFCDDVMREMRAIVLSLRLNVGGQGVNQIRHYSVNYTAGRIADRDNPYYNIFNRLHFYESLSYDAVNLSYDSFVNRFIEDVQNDLDILRILNASLYDTIMAEQFNGNTTVAEFYSKLGFNSYGTITNLLANYVEINEILGNYRNNTRVEENEANVVISQLDSNMIDLIDKFPNESVKGTVRSYMLYYIYYWEFNHVNVGRDNIRAINMGRMSIELLNASNREIFERYMAIKRQVNSFAFMDDVDFASLDIAEMRNVFLDNLYKAYYGSELLQCVFEVLKARNIEFSNFHSYESHINSIDNPMVLTELYNAIRTRVIEVISSMPVVSKNPVNSDESESTQPIQPGESEDYAGPVNPKTLETFYAIAKIIMAKNIDDTEDAYDLDDFPYILFMGSWKKFVHDYPDVANIVLSDMMGGDLDKYIRNNNFDFDKIRRNIYNFLWKHYKISLPDSFPRNITPEYLQYAKDIILDDKIPDAWNYYYDDEGDYMYFEGSMYVLQHFYTKIHNDIFYNLFNRNEKQFIIDNDADFPKIRRLIIEYLDKKYLGNLSNVSDNSGGNQNSSNPLKPVDRNKVNEFEAMRKVIMDTKIFDIGGNYPNKAMSYFMGAWKRFVMQFSQASNIVLNQLMKGDVENYVKANNYDCDLVRTNIVNFLEAYYGLNGPIEVVPDSLTPDDYSKIKMIFESHSIRDNNHVYADDNECLFMGSWNVFVNDYPTFAAVVFDQLMQNNLRNHINNSGRDFEKIRSDILAFLQQAYNVNASSAGAPIQVVSDELDNMIRIINSDEYEDPQGRFIELDADFDAFLGAWEKFASDYPVMAQNVLTNVLGGDVVDFSRKNNYNITKIRLIITDYLGSQKKIRLIFTDDLGSQNSGSDANQNSGSNTNPNSGSNTNPNSGSNTNPNSGSEISIIISSRDLNRMTEILKSNQYENPEGGMNELSFEQNAFYGSLAQLGNEFPNVYNVVLRNLFRGDMHEFLRPYGGFYSNARTDIIKFLNGLYEKSRNSSSNANQNANQNTGSNTNQNSGSNTNSRNILSLNDNQFNEIRGIMENLTIYPTRTHWIISDSMVRLYGSWDLIEDRYPVIAALVLENLFGGDLSQYANKMDLPKNDFKKVRQNIIEFIRLNFYGNKPIIKELVVVGNKDVSNCTVEEVYDYVVKQIRESNSNNEYRDFLINQVDSAFYAYLQLEDLNKRASMPQSSYNYHIDAIKKRLLDELDGMSIRYNKYISAYDEIVGILSQGSNLTGDMKKKAFVDNWKKLEDKYPRVAKAVFEGIFSNSLPVFNYYLEYNGIDAVRSAICNYVQKNLLSGDYVGVEIPDGGIQISAGIVDDIKNVMRNKTIPAEGYDQAGEKELMYVMGSWNTLRDRYPEVFEYIEKNRFNGSFENYALRLGFENMDNVREDVIKYAESLLFNSNLNNNPSSNNIGKFVIDKENVVGASLEQVEVLLQNAVMKALALTEIVKVNNATLANELTNRIDALYANALLNCQSGNPQWQYIKFVNALNDLFSDLNSSDYRNTKMANMFVEKAQLDQMSEASFQAEMRRALNTSMEFVKDINKTDVLLANTLADKIQKLYNKKIVAVQKGGSPKENYEDFINKVNQMIVNSIPIFNEPRDLGNLRPTDLTNEQILARINQTLSKPTNYPSYLNVKYNQLKKEKEPDRQDLLDLLKEAELMGTHHNVLVKKQNRLMAITGKTHYFEGSNFNTQNLNDLKKEILKQLKDIKDNLPNLYHYLNASLNVNMSKISTLDQGQRLRMTLSNLTADFMRFYGMDNGWYNMLKAEYHKNTYLKNALRHYFDTNPEELGFSKILQGANSTVIREYIISEMNILKSSNSALYDYYLKVYFNGSSSPNKFFNEFEKGIAIDELDIKYLDFYNTLQGSIQQQKDILKNISEYSYDSGKYKSYYASFEQNTGMNLNLKANKYVQVLLMGIININDYNLQTELYEILMNGIDQNLIIKDSTINKIKIKILNYLGIKKIIDDDEFAVLTSLMNLNTNSYLRTLLLTQYVKIINKHYNTHDKDYKKHAEYARIYAEILKYRTLSVYKVILYPKELEVLNTLSELRAYGILDSVLVAKLNEKVRKTDIVSKGFVSNIMNNVLNSIEYKLYTQGEGANITNSTHINVYYRVFDLKDHLPDTLDGLIKKIQEDMDLLAVEDHGLYNEICDDFFASRTNIRNYVNGELYGPDLDKYESLLKKYVSIYNLLGNYYRNNSILYSIENLTSA